MLYFLAASAAEFLRLLIFIFDFDTHGKHRNEVIFLIITTTASDYAEKLN